MNKFNASGLRHRRSLKLLQVAMLVGSALLSAQALGKGGTAKPPGGGGGGGVPAPTTTPTLVVPLPQPPAAAIFSTPAEALTRANAISQFDTVGFLSSVTCSPQGGGAAQTSADGGTAVVNGITITIPDNMIVQFPANTLTWRDAFCPTPTTFNYPPLALDGTGGSAPAGTPTAVTLTPYISVEFSITGNIVEGRHIAALVTVSQQSLNNGAGYITAIDAATGGIWVGTRGGTSQAFIRINDPNGRFGRSTLTGAASDIDPRFSVDDQNPTIKTAETAYPLCVPRTTDSSDDPLCPQRNRPARGAAACNRNFAFFGLAPKGGDLSPDPAHPFCTAFVMPNPAGTLAATDPDARKQAPFKVGDYITWGGTLMRGKGINGGDLIAAHTINANLGIYTAPGTFPVYIAAGDLGIGVEPSFPVAGAAGVPAINGAAQETTPRLFMEAGVSDITAIVDIYLIDKSPADGTEKHRWMTPEGMTGALAEQVANAQTTTTQPFGGGIITQFNGPLPGRARIRANKVIQVPCVQFPATGCTITASPTRYIRAVVRKLCAPAAATGFVFIDGAGAFATGADQTGVTTSGANAASCLQRAQFANGLFTGQYFAPVAEFIFPENTSPGAPTVPSNFWALDFIRRGEGNAPGSSSGPLNPTPW